MDLIAKFLKADLPRYLKTLPLPKDFAGFAKLNRDEWLVLAPLLVTVAIIAISQILLVISWTSKDKQACPLPPPPRVNKSIDLSNPKVVHTCKTGDIEDMGKKVYCRCWKSKKFPECDGSHVKHNEQTGDNVGPLIIAKS